MRVRKKKHTDEKILAFKNFVFDKTREEELKNYFGKWNDLFPNKKSPLFVELGTGKGDFISTVAEMFPERNFIGIEQEQEVLYKAARKVDEKKLTNVKLACVDVKHLAEIFDAGEIFGLYINFCDPWPKARHAKRRLTSKNFLQLYRNLIQKNGHLYFKTDNENLFDFSLEEFASENLLVKNISRDLHSEQAQENYQPAFLEETIKTEYERKFSELGEKIFRCEVIFP